MFCFGFYYFEYTRGHKFVLDKSLFDLISKEKQFVFIHDISLICGVLKFPIYLIWFWST